MTTTLYVCTTCRRDLADEQGLCGGKQLFSHLQTALADAPIQVNEVQCLMGCDHGCNVHLRGADDQFSYVIGKFSPDTQSAEAISDYVKLYLESDNGRVPFKLWPSDIKGHFIARIPPWKDELPS